VSGQKRGGDHWENKLMKYEEPFMIERNQPEADQEREGLDALSS